uniref:DPF1-3 N-terminal domain-containing protein n=1 Tax=Apteryx owenii TaxID=8824 RepID=A0A8B9S6I8_APTOW
MCARVLQRVHTHDAACAWPVEACAHRCYSVCTAHRGVCTQATQRVHSPSRSVHTRATQHVHDLSRRVHTRRRAGAGLGGADGGPCDPPAPPGLAPGQIYTYPARCWRKKRRLNILEDPRLRPCEYCEAPLKKEGGLPEGPVLEALLCAEPGDKKTELKEEEAVLDCQKQPMGEFPHDLEGDELEDDTPRRKNKAKGKAYGIGGMRKRQDATTLEDRDKPYVCDSE